MRCGRHVWPLCLGGWLVQVWYDSTLFDLGICAALRGILVSMDWYSQDDNLTPTLLYDLLSASISL